MNLRALLLIIAAYLLGSLSPAYWVTRALKGIDLRRYGSASLTGSNVGEQLGTFWKIVVGTFDFLKGFVPAALATYWQMDGIVIALAGLAAVVGHNWSLYFRFAGGRGLATVTGILLAWDVRLFIYFLAVLGGSVVVRQPGPGPIIGTLLLAPIALLFSAPPWMVGGCAVIPLLLILKRLEANQLPLPADPREKRAVLWRRFWYDRDVPLDQPWQERKEID